MTTPTLTKRPTDNLINPEPPKYPPLTAHDRCDATTVTREGGVLKRGRCGAQAFVRVIMPSGLDLLFCGHCMGEQTIGKNTQGSKAEKQSSLREKLIAQGAVIDNNAYTKINQKPTSINQ